MARTAPIPPARRLASYTTITLPSDARGGVDMAALEQVLAEHGHEVAALMMTNPNTLGVFDEHIVASRAWCMTRAASSITTAPTPTPLWASRGQATWASMSCISTCTRRVARPTAAVDPARGLSAWRRIWCRSCRPAACEVEAGAPIFWEDAGPLSIGRVRANCGNFLVLVRAYTYIRSNGPDGLRRVSESAVLNANYLMRALQDDYDLPFDRDCMHEFVFSADRQKALGVSAMDIAKRLLDFGIHPPTTYFPLIVHEALMIEPTETETKETLDEFIAVMRQIAREAAEAAGADSGGAACDGRGTARPDTRRAQARLCAGSPATCASGEALATRRGDAAVRHIRARGGAWWAARAGMNGAGSAKRSRWRHPSAAWMARRTM